MEPQEIQLNVSIDGRVARRIPAESINVPWARGAPIGRAGDGTLNAGYASSVVLEDDTIVTMTGAGTCVRWRPE